MKGLIAGMLTLIALQALTANDKATAQSGKLLVWLSTGLTHALSPKVAAIPTRKSAQKPAASTSKAPATGGIVLPRNPSVGTVSV